MAKLKHIGTFNPEDREKISDSVKSVVIELFGQNAHRMSYRGVTDKDMSQLIMTAYNGFDTYRPNCLIKEADLIGLIFAGSLNEAVGFASRPINSDDIYPELSCEHWADYARRQLVVDKLGDLTGEEVTERQKAWKNIVYNPEVSAGECVGAPKYNALLCYNPDDLEPYYGDRYFDGDGMRVKDRSALLGILYFDFKKMDAPKRKGGVSRVLEYLHLRH